MKSSPPVIWKRAVRALKTARLNFEDGDFDGAASRAYYAAFFAVSALFAAEGRFFSKHSQLDSAVHRNLKQTGRWSNQLAAAFSSLAADRTVADYGGDISIPSSEAARAIEDAAAILVKVQDAHPDIFSGANLE